MHAIARAITVCGSQSKLAAAIKVHPSFVSQWVTCRRSVPARMALPIERATGGAVTRYELRPDIFGADPHHREAA